MEDFVASVQYDDWKGSACADDVMPRQIREVLSERNLIRSGEFVVGLSFHCGDNYADTVQTPNIHVYVIKAKDSDEAASIISTSAVVKTREVELELSLVDFFAMFKQFDLRLGWKGVNFHGAFYTKDAGQ